MSADVRHLSTFDILRQMSSIRQIEAAELMLVQNNFTRQFTRALLAATPMQQLVDPRRRKKTGEGGITIERIARMERELASLQSQVKSVEDTYAIDNLHLTVAKSYVSKLLSNTRIVRWLGHNRQEYLNEFQVIVEMTSIAKPKAAAE